MTGGVAEIVADSWPTKRPMTLVTASGGAPRGACAYRIDKDATDTERHTGAVSLRAAPSPLTPHRHWSASESCVI